MPVVYMIDDKELSRIAVDVQFRFKRRNTCAVREEDLIELDHPKACIKARVVSVDPIVSKSKLSKQLNALLSPSLGGWCVITAIPLNVTSA